MGQSNWYSRTAVASVGLTLLGCAARGPAPTASQREPQPAPPKLTLTWVLSTPISESDGGPARRVELVARSEHTIHRVDLGTHSGVLVPSEQSLCNPSLKGDSRVSVLIFATMGPETLTVTRIQASELEVTFHVEADDEPAKLDGTLATLSIPARATIEEAILEMTGVASSRPVDCRGAPYEPTLEGSGAVD